MDSTKGATDSRALQASQTLREYFSAENPSPTDDIKAEEAAKTLARLARQHDRELRKAHRRLSRSFP